VAKGKVSMLIGVWPIHLLALLIAIVLIRNRVNPSLKWWRRQLPAKFSSK
jgi:lipopolysaccharide export system permease protein